MTSSLVYPEPPSNASKELRESYTEAANGDMSMQIELGMAGTDNNPYVPFDHGIFWLERAADQGSAFAMSLLSSAYLRSDEHYNFATGRFWNRMAADHGDEECILIEKILDVLGECCISDILDCIEELYQRDSEGVFNPLILGDSFFCGSYVI